MGELSAASSFPVSQRSRIHPNPAAADGSEAGIFGQPVLNHEILTVLLVDDNAINRKLLRTLVEADGYRAVEAEDGVAALTVLEHTPVDVILSDLLMPNLDGYSFCSAVRQRSEFGHIPFVLCTALQLSAEDEAFALNLGANRVATHQDSTRAMVAILEEVTREMPLLPKAGRALQRVPADEVMKQYRECMVRELEERSIRLELRTADLARSNADLERRTAELARSNADLEQFASIASHDLQEPLRAVTGCVQIFQRKYTGKLDSGADELIGMIVDGSARMKALIAGLLDYSRAGQKSPGETIDAAVVLEESLANLKSAILESNAEVVYDGLPSLRFGKAPFAQVIQNLVGNALKYRGNVPPRIHIQANREVESWVFRIADNGIGFEQQYAEKIFSIFQRLHTREAYVGTGIGLSVVKKIIERRGGKIWAESVPGQGSTFFFSVPDQEPEPASPPL